jgi:hypothetical protein
MGTVHFGDGCHEGVGVSGFWLMVAGAVISSIAFTAGLWLLIRREVMVIIVHPVHQPGKLNR